MATPWGHVSMLRPDGDSGGSAPDGMERRSFERAHEVLLGADNPAVVLEAIVDGDPLGLHGLSQERIEARFLILAPTRVFEQSVFRVTAMSAVLDPKEDLKEWLLCQVDLAIDMVLRRDQEALQENGLPSESVAESAEYLSRIFGFEPAVSLRASARFNQLSPSVREAYMALMVERRSLEECVEAGMGTAEALKQRVREGAAVILAEAKMSRFERGMDELMGGEG